MEEVCHKSFCFMLLLTTVIHLKSICVLIFNIQTVLEIILVHSMPAIAMRADRLLLNPWVASCQQGQMCTRARAALFGGGKKEHNFWLAQNTQGQLTCNRLLCP